MFSIRYFTEYQKTGGFQEFVDRYTSSCISCIEVSEKGKEHIHAVITSDYCKSTIRKEFRKIVLLPKSAGNKAYSLKLIKDKEKAINYVCKEGKKFILKGYVDNDIKTYQKNWTGYTKKLKKANSKGIPYFKQIFEKVKNNKPLKSHICQSIADNTYIHDNLLRTVEMIVIKSYIEDVKTFPNQYQIKSVANSLIGVLLLKYGFGKSQTAIIMHTAIFGLNVNDLPTNDFTPIHNEILKYIKEPQV